MEKLSSKVMFFGSCQASSELFSYPAPPLTAVQNSQHGGKNLASSMQLTVLREAEL